eukprot:CAMPEP_0202891528 /NCGR_PEP_ID=MMETSP1392-20130828/1568_1 /ASSEMBLY_ACC=CAM_ASM_000868 /TAXON_ID=225041 /ORGANISM="Chlamydomonas chlamydogama, Strain SAG 11-48b" /LENGTH=345 /DNA_ID=CAMNT_0049575309 /DNA_START=200 /DNA_END=1237 /DNA_ORIENTATION=+
MITLQTVDSADEHLFKAIDSHGRYGLFETDKGKKLSCYFWPSQASSVRGIILLCHGHGCHVTYNFLKSEYDTPGAPVTYPGSWVERMNNYGFSVCGIDYEGAGRSPGKRGLVTSFEQVAQDVNAFAQEVSSSSELPGFGPDKPLYLCGYSMGGNVAARAAQLAKQVQYKGVVLLAPMLQLHGTPWAKWNPIVKALAEVVNTLVPTLAVASHDATNQNPFTEVTAAYHADPCSDDSPIQVRTGIEYMKACDRVMAGAADMEHPLLVFHSMKDLEVDPEGSKQFIQLVKSTDKTFVSVDHMFHALMKEPGTEEVLQKVVEWLSERAPGAPDLAAAGQAKGAAPAASA